MTHSESESQSHAYGEEWYWDERYRREQAAFDWYQRYEAVAPLLRLLLRPTHRLLLVGCGNSPFGEKMVNDGYEHVVNIDISSVVIRSMQSKYFHLPHLQYMKMDVRDMAAFEDNSFDAVLDKGTLDSIMCGSDSQANASKMLKEVHRVLKERGIYIMITYGDPSYRLGLLRDLNLWNVNIHVIDKIEKSPDKRAWDITKPLPLNESGSSIAEFLGPKPDVHYIYVCTKALFPILNHAKIEPKGFISLVNFLHDWLMK